MSSHIREEKEIAMGLGHVIMEVDKSQDLLPLVSWGLRRAHCVIPD